MAAPIFRQNFLLPEEGPQRGLDFARYCIQMVVAGVETKVFLVY